jgi:hypothetical protein
LEVWYLTATDERSRAGLWVHHEVVAPPHGAAHVHGWASWFATEPGREPRTERFGPTPVRPDDLGRGGWWHRGDTVGIGPARVVGQAGSLAWDLAVVEPDTQPVFTFSRLVWERQLLPAAQVVPLPRTRLVGTVTVDGQEQVFDGIGALAHIWGHGNAQRWCWLHADLADGDVLELVAATARRPGLRRVPPLALVQLRVGGRDWPRNPLLVSVLFRTRISSHGFSVRGLVGRRRLRIDVTLLPERSVVLDYADPDGAPATCTNSERADAAVRVDRWWGRWRPEASWTLSGTAHAEIGARPLAEGR